MPAFYIDQLAAEYIHSSRCFSPPMKLDTKSIHYIQLNEFSFADNE